MPIIRGNSLYLTVEGPFWTDAKASAELLGGNLVSINSADENIFLRDKFDFTGLETGPTDPHCFWIGLYYSDNVWNWLDGTTVDKNNYANWQPGDPDYLEVEIYGKISPGQAAYWGNSVNNDSTFGEAPNVSFGIAELQLDLSIESDSLLEEGSGIFATSISLSAGSETSASLLEGACIYWQVSGITEDDLEIGALTGSGILKDGMLSVEHSLISDSDSGELFKISIFSDSSLNQQIGETEVFSIHEQLAVNDNQSFLNIIHSNSGRGRLEGTKGADRFTFDLFKPFGKQNADKILRFNASQGDTIGVSSKAFPSLKNTKNTSLVSTSNKKQLKKLSSSDYDFIYFEKRGRLYFNGNGRKKNWGRAHKGGLVAFLSGKPGLSVNDLTLLD